MRVSQNVMEAMEERLENVFLPYRVIILIMKRLALLSAMQEEIIGCLLYTSPSPRDRQKSRMPSSA